MNLKISIEQTYYIFGVRFSDADRNPKGTGALSGLIFNLSASEGPVSVDAGGIAQCRFRHGMSISHYSAISIKTRLEIDQQTVIEQTCYVIYTISSPCVEKATFRMERHSLQGE